MNKVALSLLFLVGIRHFSAVEAGKYRPLRLLKTECESLDTSLVRFPRCSVSTMNDSRPIMNMHVQVLQNLTSIVLNVKLYRKVNKKFQPFLYDDMIDFCQIFEKGGTRHIFWGTFYEKFAKYSNFNHSCPYDHDIIADNFTFDDNVFQIFPVPKGQYMVEWIYTVNNVRACKIRMFCERV